MAANDPHLKKKVVVAVGPRPVVALLDLERYEPVLASAARSYMIVDDHSPSSLAAAQDTLHVELNTKASTSELISITPEHGTALVFPRTPPTPPAPRPQKPGSAAVVSPRVRMRPMPPMGIATREDVDIYRYSQAAAQRMAIRPLFEHRRELEAGTVGKTSGAEEDGDDEELQSVSSDVAEWENEHVGDEVEGGEQDTATINDKECQRAVSLATGDAEVDTEGDEIVDEIGCDELGGQPEERNSDDEQMRFVTGISLSLANCHEPFLTSEPPLLQKLCTAIQQTSRATAGITRRPELSPNDRDTSGQLSAAQHPISKLIWNGSRAINGRQFSVSIMLASDGGICISCTEQGNERQEETNSNGRAAVTTLTDDDLALMKKLRGDLTALTPEWSSWLVSRLSLRDKSSIRLDLNEQSSVDGVGKQHVFSKIVTLSTSDDNGSESTNNESTEDREVAVAVFRLEGENALVIRMEDTLSKQTNELRLGKPELQSIAAGMGILDSTQVDAGVDSLLYNSAFLGRLCESDVVRLAILMAPTLDPVIDGDHGFVAKSTSRPSVRATLRKLGVDSYALNDFRDQEEVHALIRDSNILTSIALLARAHSDDVVLAVTRTLSQQEAVLMHAKHYVTRAESTEAGDPSFEASVQQRIQAAKADRLTRLAFASIVDDLLVDLLRAEYQAARHDARYSSEYRDHFATKLQATFRMCSQRRAYKSRQRDRQLAARVIQARQRGITSRQRFRDLQVERDRMLYYRLAPISQQNHAAHVESTLLASYDLGQRVAALQEETERAHHRMLMQVLAGYASDADTNNPHEDEEDGIPSGVIQTAFDKYGSAAVGCWVGLGDTVTQILRGMADTNEDPSTNSTTRRTYSLNQVSAALLLALRTSHREPSPWLAEPLPTQEQQQQQQQPALQSSLEFGDKSRVPRWVLKVNAALRLANCERQAQSRYECHAAGKGAARYIARSYRLVLATSLTEFEQCRRVWEAVANAQEEKTKASVGAEYADQLVQRCLDLMVASIKERGVDTGLLLEALNSCYRSEHGKRAVTMAEEQFNRLAAANAAIGPVSILSLRDEVVQELDELDKLLAMRCLDLARGDDTGQLPPASALLHIVLKGQLHNDQVRLALPAVLPFASVSDKFELARRMVRGYAGSAFGDALNQVCWSCVDSTESITAEAAQLADLLTRLSDGDDDQFDCDGVTTVQDKDDVSKPSSTAATTVASRALARLTGAPFVRFLQFLAWVAHANISLQTRVRLLLSPLAAKHELVRVASALSALENARDASALYARRFSRDALESSDAFWVQYQAQFGQEARARAAGSCVRHGEL